MHIHILGICGTFMGSLALLAKELGYRVTGSDEHVYPPMSTQLQNAGITLMQGFDRSHLKPAPDLVVVGNAMTRGIDAVEYLLNSNISYTSGPEFLARFILKDRHVLAVAGTHGKTTTTTMLAWILHYNGIDTGFLIGGVPQVGKDDSRLSSIFSRSSHLGQDFFVVEADEYDSAFFDKRSKFIHYRPKTVILNNLEFDHADIFEDLQAIQKQFHHLVRIIPNQGLIITPKDDDALNTVLQMGCYTPIVHTSLTVGDGDLSAHITQSDGGRFKVKCGDKSVGEVIWQMSGRHNVANALSAIAAAHHVGVSYDRACQALSAFLGIKRRMELVGVARGVAVYDDFAHHPTAIATTLDGAKKRFGDQKIWAIIEPRSNTMQMGVHKDRLAQSADLADTVIWYEPKGADWGMTQVATSGKNTALAINDIDEIVSHIKDSAKAQDVIIVMSNGGFGGIHQKLLKALADKIG